MAFQTEYTFELPKGYVDTDGTVHKRGKMRLATAADEIIPMKDPRVQQNPSYLTVILLSRVITELGSVTAINTGLIEKLFTADLAYLQDLYQKINQIEVPKMDVVCPHCSQSFQTEALFLGEA